MKVRREACGRCFKSGGCKEEAKVRAASFGIEMQTDERVAQSGPELHPTCVSGRISPHWPFAAKDKTNPGAEESRC